LVAFLKPFDQGFFGLGLVSGGLVFAVKFEHFLCSLPTSVIPYGRKYASNRITFINIRNGATMEPNNLSASIYADTYRPQRRSISVNT
jgi:hypothetical protein